MWAYEVPAPGRRGVWCVAALVLGGTGGQRRSPGGGRFGGGRGRRSDLGCGGQRGAGGGALVSGRSRYLSPPPPVREAGV